MAVVLCCFFGCCFSSTLVLCSVDVWPCPCFSCCAVADALIGRQVVSWGREGEQFYCYLGLLPSDQGP